MLVRTWNLFHGNTVPPQREAFLDEMIRLATADDPDVLCVQEVPGWALSRFTVGDMASRPPLGVAAGRAITSLNHGIIRSAVSGQGNAIRVLPSLRVVDHHVLVLNPARFRAQLGVDARVQLRWAKERRIVQALRLARGTRTFVVANTHCTGTWPYVAQAELMRAAWFADSIARPDEPLILAGDFNLHPDTDALASLTGPEWGFSAAGPGIDHILVRGAEVSEPRVWPADRRRRADGTLLSDHAPVEVEIEFV
ncbi:MAG TPA: endonuclease/exonuclease/phosphatase family protein [Gaiellaceae bacterium]|nr:endonuclease/exonuclease/phosphatase family protein [Gaiellaceae bacterium]